MKHILSFGGGVDSSTLLAIHLSRPRAAYLLGISLESLDTIFPSLDAAVFSDPGAEFNSTYENIAYAKGKARFYNFPVHSIHLVKDGKQYTIVEWLAHNGTLPLLKGGAHTCSMKFKGDVMHAWAEKLYPNENITWYIGIEANETKRANRFQGAKGGKHISKYPLIELNLTREDCERLLRELNWGMTVHKSSCVFCPWCTEEELRDTYNNYPDKWAMIRKVEHDFSITSPRKYKAFIDGGCKVNAGGRALPGTWKKDSWSDGHRLFCRTRNGNKNLLSVKEWEELFEREKK